MTKEEKPCCAAAAAAKVKHLMVGGNSIGITNLDNILKSAEAVAPEGEKAVRSELLRLVKTFNYVPRPAEKAYEDALYAEYLRRVSKDKGPTCE